MSRTKMTVAGLLHALPHRRYLAILSILFAIIWIALGIAPLDRNTWFLENLAVALLAVATGCCHRRLVMSRISYTLIFLFLCLHEVGAHYTYAKVPYNEWFAALFGERLNDLLGWQRNNYDRVVHFLYGLFMAYPVREVFLRVANVRGFWGYFLPLDLTMSTSMLFELLEWLTAEIFHGGATAYLGMQGDIWDAQKDMALASLGAVLAMVLTAAINKHFQRDFNREWADSLRVKSARPLGEDEAIRMLNK